MSVEAISWALNLAPVPADRGGQPSSACKFVLVGASDSPWLRRRALTASLRADGVQPAQERGAAVAPEPSREPSTEPSAASAQARSVPGTADTAGGGQAVGEFFAVLGEGWRLTADQRARLAPAVQAALEAGWVPQALAAFAGANTLGVRNLYAVLAARLSSAELPPPQRERPARPPWCGRCDEVTRMLGFDGDAPRPCPHCKPWAAASRAARRDNGPSSRLGSWGDASLRSCSSRATMRPFGG